MFENIISKESAQDQLDLLLEYYDVEIADIEKVDMRDIVQGACNRLRRAIQKGSIEIKITEDSIEVFQHLSRPLKGLDSPILYREITGKAKIAMRDSVDNDVYGRLYAFLGGLCGHGAAIVMQLRGKDLSIAECLGQLFLQV